MARREMLQYFSTPDGERRAYFASGDGLPLVVVPGWSMHPDRDREDPVSRPFWDDLADRCRVISYALQPALADPRDVSMASRLGDLGALADHVDLPRFDLLGFMDAAAVCVAYAARHPERVNRLVLVNAYPSGELVARPEIAEAMCHLMLANWRLGSRMMAMASCPNGPLDAQVAFTRRLREWYRPEAAVAYFRFMTSVDVTADLPRVQAPTLVIHEAGNRNFPVRGGEAVANAIPDARFVVTRGAGAGYYADYPAYSDVLGTFLGANEQAGDSELTLTHRQVEVLRQIAEGRTNSQIAEMLTVAPSTVNRHVSNILARIGAANRTEATVYAIHRGLVK